MIYLLHPTKYKYSQYFLAVQMQLSPSLAASLSSSLPLPHSVSLSCSISLSLSLLLSPCSLSFHLPRPSHLACLSWSFAFACHELPLGGTPWCTAILGLPSPPPRASLLRLCLVSPPENSFAAHRGALWPPSHRSCISADAFVSVSFHCMCVSYGCHA